MRSVSYTHLDVYKRQDYVGMSAEIGDALGKLRTYMFRYLYTNPIAKSEELKADKMRCV